MLASAGDGMAGMVSNLPWRCSTWQGGAAGGGVTVQREFSNLMPDTTEMRTNRVLKTRQIWWPTVTALEAAISSTAFVANYSGDDE